MVSRVQSPASDIKTEPPDSPPSRDGMQAKECHSLSGECVIRSPTNRGTGSLKCSLIA